MEYITVDRENIDREHICCCIADKKGENGVALKKAWMKDRFEEGLVFRRSNTRGKVFIEYIPAENAWYPIIADGYMHINCFWVSGQYKGHGHSNELLDYCIQDARTKGKSGVTIIASDKKRGFLSDPDYMEYKGFRAVDEAAPFFVLYYLPFSESAPVPAFRECAKHGKTDEPGMVLYYTSQCPHTAKYASLIQSAAGRHGYALSMHKIETKEQAQNAPTPFTTYSFFFNGEFVTNEILSEKKFEKFLQQHDL